MLIGKNGRNLLKNFKNTKITNIPFIYKNKIKHKKKNSLLFLRPRSLPLFLHSNPQLVLVVDFFKLVEQKRVI